MNAHDRATAAVKFAEGVGIIAVLFLSMMGLGYMAVIGDEIQQARIEAERIETPPRRDVTTWADHPNNSVCDWDCIKRIPTQGE